MGNPSSNLGSLLDYSTARRVHALTAYLFIPLLYVHVTAGLAIALKRLEALKSEKTQKTVLGAWTAVVAVVLLLALVPGGSSSLSSSVSASNSTSVGLTLEEVAKHSTENDCWVVIGNDVYNVTSLIDTHSGGREEIIAYCGTNATEVFFSKHDQSAYEVLQSYYVGSIGNSSQGSFETGAKGDREKEEREDD
nr:cytochrome b5-like heme/steroid binding domain-containing protein [Thermococcus alcaliphilus]